MYNTREYWMRWLAILVGSEVLNLLLDRLFKIRMNSAMDFLVFIVLFCVGMYFFIVKRYRP